MRDFCAGHEIHTRYPAPGSLPEVARAVRAEPASPVRDRQAGSMLDAGPPAPRVRRASHPRCASQDDSPSLRRIPARQVENGTYPTPASRTPEVSASSLLGRRKKPGQDRRRLLPFISLFLHLLLPCPRQFIKLRPPIVFR